MNKKIEEIVSENISDAMQMWKESKSGNQSSSIQEAATNLIERRNRILKFFTEQATQAIEQLIENRIKPHLDYCEEQTGVRVCKNCGLTDKENK